MNSLRCPFQMGPSMSAKSHLNESLYIKWEGYTVGRVATQQKYRRVV